MAPLARKTAPRDFACQECGKTFSLKGAERASSNGCPKCGGSDIDLAESAIHFNTATRADEFSTACGRSVAQPSAKTRVRGAVTCTACINTFPTVPAAPATFARANDPTPTPAAWPGETRNATTTEIHPPIEAAPAAAPLEAARLAGMESALPDYYVRFVEITNGPERHACDGEIVFRSGFLAGMKLVGFAVWRGADSDLYVTFPSRAFGTATERRYFDFLRASDYDPAVPPSAQPARRVKDAILEEYRAWRGIPPSPVIDMSRNAAIS